MKNQGSEHEALVTRSAQDIGTAALHRKPVRRGAVQTALKDHALAAHPAGMPGKALWNRVQRATGTATPRCSLFIFWHSRRILLRTFFSQGWYERAELGSVEASTGWLYGAVRGKSKDLHVTTAIDMVGRGCDAHGTISSDVGV